MESEWLLITADQVGAFTFRQATSLAEEPSRPMVGVPVMAAGGGGGRIAVIASTSSFTGVIHAYGGTGSTPGAAGRSLSRPGGQRTLLIDNQNTSTVRLSSVPAGNYTFDSVKVIGLSSATFANFSTVTIAGINAFFDGDNTSTATVVGTSYGGTILNVYASSLTVRWGDVGNPSKTTYTAQISTMSSFVPVTQSSVTLNRSWTINGLGSGTTYYARVGAGYATLYPGGGYVVIGSTLMPGQSSPGNVVITAVCVAGCPFRSELQPGSNTEY